MSDFAIPAVRTALITVAGAALPGVQVVRGQAGTYVADEQVLIGRTVWDAEPANVGLPSRWDETFDIDGQIRAYAGDVDEETRETRALEMFQTLADAIDADQSLGGVCLRAYLSHGELESGATDRGGSAAVLDFTVHIVNQTT